MTHLLMLKCFVLYYKRKSREHDMFLSENDVMNIEKDQFYLYCGSDDYFTYLSACVKESSTKQVDTLDVIIVDLMYAPESIQTENVCRNSFYLEGLAEEHVVTVEVAVDTSHLDVIRADICISECNISEDVLVKIDPPKYPAQKHLEEEIASDDSY